MIRINVHLALASLRAAKLRSLLTMVAVIIGVSSFVVVTSTVDGLRTATVTEINGLGGNLVSVLSGDVIVEDAEGNESFDPLGSEGDATLTPEDLEDIASIEGVEAIAPFHIIQASVSRDGVEQDRVIVGATNEQYPAAFNHQVAEGNFLSDKSATGGHSRTIRFAMFTPPRRSGRSFGTLHHGKSQMVSCGHHREPVPARRIDMVSTS